MLYLIAFMALSAGLGSMAAMEANTWQSDIEARNRVEANIAQRDYVMRSVRRQAQINPRAFPRPVDGPAEVSEDELDDVFNNGFRNLGVTRVRMMPNGTVRARLRNADAETQTDWAPTAPEVRVRQGSGRR